ncbi:MAG TPA: hypothetical protein VEX86_18025 [Longimicrobium sp.]|nr:hypothetical protein [Longimicrobium sp.]
MENSRAFTLAALILAFVSCVAALLVVPEVRCMVGLDPSLLAQDARCKARPAAGTGIAASWRSGGGSQPLDVSAEARVIHIRTRFNDVEQAMESGLYGSVRKEITGISGDSAYATIYVGDGEIPKIRARVYSGDRRTSMQAYYEGGELLFVYRTVARILPSGPSDIEQERYYFGPEGMIRWLDTRREPVSPSSDRFRDRGREVAAFASTLLGGSRTDDPVIAF